MKPVLKKASYKDAQRITRLLLRMGRTLISGRGNTADLGIRAFKRGGATPAEVKKFKNDAWGGLADEQERRAEMQNAKLRKPSSRGGKARKK